MGAMATPIMIWQHAAHRVPRRGCREHSGEPLTEHERRVLEHRVEQPPGGQRQLLGTPPAGRFPRCCAARDRRPRAIHSLLAANSQSQRGAPWIAERAGGITMCNQLDRGYDSPA